MPPGKLASQAGHAYLGAFLAASPDTQSLYHKDGIGTKICLSAPDLPALLRFHDEALALGLPAVLIEDTGRNTTFNGVPTVSSVGIGPISSSQARFLRKLKLLG